MEMQTPATSADTTPDPADIAIAQAEARQRRRWRLLIGGGIVSVLVSYPLSLGLVHILHRQGLIPNGTHRILGVIYYPISFTIDNVPLVKHFYEWYLGIEIE